MFTCDIGDAAHITVVFTDSAGGTVDPTTITLYLQQPSGTVGTYTYAGGDVIKSSQGSYYYNGTATAAGYYDVRWVGAGAAVAAEQSRYYVREANA